MKELPINKELSIDQEAQIFRDVYKAHCPDYYPIYQKKQEYPDYNFNGFKIFGNYDPKFNPFSTKKTNNETGKKSVKSICLNNIICNICGRTGHDSEHCQRIPTIEELELSINDDISFAVIKIKSDSEKKKKMLQDSEEEINEDVINSRIYDEDQFGLFVVDGGENDPIDVDGSLGQHDLYCINCGQKGHTFSNCTKPNLSDILNYLKIDKLVNNNNPMGIRSKFLRFWERPNTH